MTIPTITSNTQIYANGPDASKPGYNDIRSAVVSVLGTNSLGYGVPGIQSTAVGKNNTNITALDWSQLLADFNVVYQHQNNTTYTPSQPGPSTTNPIRADWVNDLIGQINSASTNIYSRAPAGQRSAGPDTTSTFPGILPWGTTIQHQATFTWADANSANYFFNLGGRLTFELGYTPGSYTGDNATWVTIINNASTAIGALVYDRTRFVVGGSVTLYTTGTGNVITITANKVNSSTVTLTVTLTNTGAGTFLPVINKFHYEYSLGAITAPRPSISVPHTFGDSYSPVFVAHRILSVSAPTPFSFTAEQTSGSQTITLNNYGNSSLTVNGVIFSDDPNVTHHASITLPIVIAANGSSTFNLTYSSSTPGTFYSSFLIQSDNDAGDVTVTTEQDVAKVPFSFTLSPSGVSLDPKTTRSVEQQKFNIVPSHGNYTIYTASISAGSGFTLSTAPADGPIVTFSPGTLGVGVYSTRLTVNITSDNGSYSTYADITINLVASANVHYGSFLSAYASYDSVIGVSYDMISGVNYITIGVGMGADGSPDLNNGGQPYVNIDNLGITADPNFAAGPALYKVSNGAWCNFLNTYGAWVNHSGTPINAYAVRSYAFTAPAGTYSWEFSVDNTGYFEIDGALAGDYRDAGGYGYQQSRTGTIELSATPGDLHTVTFYAENTGGPAGIGIRILDQSSLEVWSTLTPIRSGTSFLYWAEAYRIKLDGTARTYYTNDWCAKDGGVIFGTYRWGDFFGQPGSVEARSICVVTDDGNGNIGIKIPNYTQGTGDNGSTITISNLTEAFHYYSTHGRFTNLEPTPVGDGTQTHLFTGFDNQGNVQTILVTYPGFNSGGGSFGTTYAF